MTETEKGPGQEARGKANQGVAGNKATASPGRESRMTKRKPPEEHLPDGRPPMYSDPLVMQAKIEEYFSMCDAGEKIEQWNPKKKEVERYHQKIPYTVPGLAFHLGFATRKALFDYKQKPEFRNTITRAKLRIENQRNAQALAGVVDPRFSQFDLKNNFGWKEQTDIVVKPLEALSDEELDVRIESKVQALQLSDDAVVVEDVTA